MKERITLLCRALRGGQPAVTALVTGCRGATPRAPGALLVLTAESAAGTVGGGQAEHDILAPARAMLGGGLPVQLDWHQCLSAEELRHMGQEYGGEEEILLLRWTPRDLPLAEQMALAMEQNADCTLRIEYDKTGWRGTLLPEAVTAAEEGCFTLKLREGGRCYVFGGGHVSQALVPLLGSVDFACVVLDERPDYASPIVFPTAETRCGAGLARAMVEHVHRMGVSGYCDEVVVNGETWLVSVGTTSAKMRYGPGFRGVKLNT